jgi:chromosome segregation ATPase
MSFTNLKSFDEFCRRFILPDDKLNVGDVVASYRNFKAYENDLRALFDQQTRLETIRDLHRDHSAASRDRVVARWLASELSHEHATASVREDAEKLRLERTAFAKEEARIGELDGLIAERKIRIKSEEAALKALPGGDLYLHLQGDKKRLAAESSRLKDIGNTVDSALRNRVQKARQWLNEVKSAPLSEPVDTAPMAAAIKQLERCSKDQTEPALGGIASGADELKTALSRAVSPTERKLREIREQKGRLREEVTLLGNGQLPFPTTVLNALNQSLPSGGRTPPAQPLCKLCEVTDEDWRSAIEVAFNRKFAIVVSDDNYPAALKIYQGLKAESPQESLIHPGKALRLARPVKSGSLAEKLEAEHPIARAIVSNLFGELMCVQRNEDLSHHDFAIQKDGFMTRGAFVERRRHYDGMPFVGLRGLEKQLVLKRGLLAESHRQRTKSCGLKAIATPK